MKHWRSLRISKSLLKGATINDISDPRPHISVLLNKELVTGLLDSGASISCLGNKAYDTLRRCNLKWKQYDKVSIRTASGLTQNVKGYVDTTVTFKQMSKPIRLYIVPSLTNELYLGIDFWLSFNLLPDLAELELDPMSQEPDEDVTDGPDLHEMTTEQQAKLDEVVDLFPSSAVEGLGKTSLIKHVIDVGATRPIKQRYHAVSPVIEKKMYAEVDRMLQLGVIEESNSAWSSPVTIVSKANGKSRLCLDARKVNQETTKDAYPMPLIE